jgi:hypothetical protein
MQATHSDIAAGSNPSAAYRARSKIDSRAPTDKDYKDREWEPRKKGKHPSAEEVQAGVMKSRASGIRGYSYRDPDPAPLPQPPAPPQPPPTSTWDWAEAPQTSTVAEWNAGWHDNPRTRSQIRSWQSDHKWSDR